LPKLSLPVRLALLVAGTTLPLILFAAGIVFNNYEQDRRDATQRVLDTVRSIRLVLDSEMQRMTGALQVLSLTNALRDRDFESFRRISQGFLDQYGEGSVVLVADREGRQVFSSVTTDTASLPPRNNRALGDKVFAEKKPAYSNLFTGAVKKRLIVTVDVPVIGNDEVIYVISFSPPIEIFQAIIEQQRPGQIPVDGLDILSVDIGCKPAQRLDQPCALLVGMDQPQVPFRGFEVVGLDPVVPFGLLFRFVGHRHRVPCPVRHL